MAKDITRANPNKPTKAQRAMLEYLAENPGTYPSRLNMRVYRALFFANPALVETRKDDNFMHRVYITHAGAKAIGRKAEAQPATVTAQAVFGVGDLVVIRAYRVLTSNPYIRMLAEAQTVGTVVDFDRARVIVEFEGAAADDGISFLPGELDLWQPDADSGADEPERKQPFMGTRSNPCRKELDTLRQENAKLMRSEDTYRQENERLRAALMPFAELWTKFVSDYEQEFVSYNPAEPKDDDWFVGGKRTYYGHRLDPLIFKSAFEALTEPVAPGDGGE